MVEKSVEFSLGKSSYMPGWHDPKNQQNKTDKFLSFFGVMCVIANSQKDKGKVLGKHILKDIVPRGFYARIEEI